MLTSNYATVLARLIVRMASPAAASALASPSALAGASTCSSSSAALATLAASRPWLLSSLAHAGALTPSTSHACAAMRHISTSYGAHATPSGVEALEKQVEDLRASVQRLESIEAARTLLSALLTWLDSARLDSAASITAAKVAEMFTPSAQVSAPRFGSAVSLEQVLPLLQKMAKEAGPGKDHITNIVAEPSKDDPTIVRATAYCLVVEPIAGARPAVTSMQLLNTKLEKGLDDKWRIKRLALEDVVANP